MKKFIRKLMNKNKNCQNGIRQVTKQEQKININIFNDKGEIDSESDLSNN